MNQYIKKICQQDENKRQQDQNKHISNVSKKTTFKREKIKQKKLIYN